MTRELHSFKVLPEINKKDKPEYFSGYLMSKDNKIAEIKDNQMIKIFNRSLLPLYFRNSQEGCYIDGWLSQRYIDKSRKNYRMLRKSFKIREGSLDAIIKNRAFNITDSFWLSKYDDDLKYDDLRDIDNKAWSIALNGEYLENTTDITPEFTNIGSYEKCWKRAKDGTWYMLKKNDNYVSCGSAIAELIAYKITDYLSIDNAEYYFVEGGDYVASKDITNNAETNLELFGSVYGEDFDESDYDTILEIMDSINSRDRYLDMLLIDAITGNIDRHVFNFGFFTDNNNGGIFEMSTIFDNNLSSTGYRWTKGYETNFAFTKIIAEFLEDNNYHNQYLNSLLGVLPTIIDETMKDIDDNNLVLVSDLFSKDVGELKLIHDHLYEFLKLRIEYLIVNLK